MVLIVTMSHEELSKNHHGGFNDKSWDERQTRLYSTGQDRDAFSYFRKYLDNGGEGRTDMLLKLHRGDAY